MTSLYLKFHIVYSRLLIVYIFIYFLILIKRTKFKDNSNISLLKFKKETKRNISKLDSEASQKALCIFSYKLQITAIMAPWNIPKFNRLQTITANDNSIHLNYSFSLTPIIILTPKIIKVGNQ